MSQRQGSATKLPTVAASPDQPLIPQEPQFLMDRGSRQPVIARQQVNRWQPIPGLQPAGLSPHQPTAEAITARASSPVTASADRASASRLYVSASLLPIVTSDP